MMNLRIMFVLLYLVSIAPAFAQDTGENNLGNWIGFNEADQAFIFLWIYNVSFSSEFRKDKDLISFIKSRKVLLIAMFLAGAHLFFIGYKGWMNPAGWHGGLPPISLVAFTFFAVGYVINLLGRE